MKKICVKVQRNKILLNISLVLVVRTNFYLVKLAWFFKAQFKSLILVMCISCLILIYAFYFLILPANKYKKYHFMNQIHAVSVFCGSSSGNEGIFETSARKLGEFLAKNNITLIYGGAKVGLMGAVADGAILSGGNVVGVIPDFIRNKEIAHEGITELIIVKSMHERKTIMYEKSDGAIILPGGFGTMDEMFELLTWGQLGLHTKPIIMIC